MKIFKAVGIMSGTSLDGVDLAYCIFIEEDENWTFTLEDAVTIPYSESWKNTLKNLENTSASEFCKAHHDYGHYIGSLVKSFITERNIKPDLVASHGHTIFHQPDKKYTVQIGDGAAIASYTGCPVVCDFRSLDVALGGQGAPLVPIGDKLLFHDYSMCLNLGGFANISYNLEGERIAYDICPVNIVLNELAGNFGKSYDHDGELSQQGKVNPDLLKSLNEIPFYSLKPPKSLGKEWVIMSFYPILSSFKIPVENKMRTITEHIAIQLANSFSHFENTNVLITGGGAYNSLLIELLKSKTNHEIIIPDKKIIEFKEALIFAFLGVLRLEGKINTLASVTGASRDSSGGAVY